MAPPIGVSRRDFLTRALRPRDAALAATGGLVWSYGLVRARGTELTVRPPGALEEAGFLATCTRCGLCVEACPYDTLKLARAEDGEAIGTPHFEPRRIPCYMCEETPCINACPTGSLVAGTAIEEARMGLAVLSDQETCLAFQGLRCEVCYRACPLMGRAISLEFRPQERTGKRALFLPVVDSEHCTGCGACEHACVLEEAAIKVLPRELAQGRLSDRYRFGWLDETETGRDLEVSESAPDLPGWEENLDRVLESMNDLSGIEEP
jgi:ferredoxin-type protein NapG